MTTTEPQTLAAFLLTRIAEDEDLARRMDSEGWYPGSYDPAFGARTVDDLVGDYWRVVADPARVLAKCEAKRGIVEARELVDAHIRRIALSDPDEAGHARSTRAGLDAAIAALALPYADHPDYDEAWRP